jgi:hypothetical protein
LALLVGQQHHRMAGRVHVQAGDVLDLGVKRRVGGALEDAQAV